MSWITTTTTTLAAGAFHASRRRMEVVEGHTERGNIELRFSFSENNLKDRVNVGRLGHNLMITVNQHNNSRIFWLEYIHITKSLPLLGYLSSLSVNSIHLSWPTIETVSLLVLNRIIHVIHVDHFTGKFIGDFIIRFIRWYHHHLIPNLERI